MCARPKPLTGNHIILSRANALCEFDDCKPQECNHEADAAKIRDGLYYQLFNPVMWHANLLTAFGKGVKMIFEFGGGIGSAETPDGKRPNLEGMIKRASKAAEYEVQYRSAINAASVRETADFVNNPEAS